MNVLVTGAAGFIGFHTCLKLVSQGHKVYGIDNINDYYDPKLKFDRLNELGFSKTESEISNNEVQSSKFKNLRFSRIDLIDNDIIDDLFKKEQFEVVCNLAAQVGKKAIKEMYPMQKGDVPKTFAEISQLNKDYEYSPNTPIDGVIKEFVY